jgi:hypothetical protein
MYELRRRLLLKASSGLTVGVLAGCFSTEGNPVTESPENLSKTTEDTTSPTDRECSSECDSMHDSVISV